MNHWEVLMEEGLPQTMEIGGENFFLYLLSLNPNECKVLQLHLGGDVPRCGTGSGK